MKNRTSVTRIAGHVRQWALDQAGVYEQDLCGWCGICSAEIWRQLRAEDIIAKIHMHVGPGLSHVFVVVEDHIVDVTATQFHEFGNKHIVIMPEFMGKSFDFYDTVEIFNSAEDLRRYQIRAKWPKLQIAFKG